MEHLTMSMFAKKEDLYKAQRDQLAKRVEKLEGAIKSACGAMDANNFPTSLYYVLDNK